jgi:hypothetical protein
MQEKEVSLRCVIATALWAAGIALVIIDMTDPPTWQPGQAGLACIGGAMVLNIRGYFIGLHRRMKDMFQMGREYEREYPDEHARVRSLR